LQHELFDNQCLHVRLLLVPELLFKNTLPYARSVATHVLLCCWYCGSAESLLSLYSTLCTPACLKVPAFTQIFMEKAIVALVGLPKHVAARQPASVALSMCLRMRITNTGCHCIGHSATVQVVLGGPGSSTSLA
jgi:hypothetical protein